MYTSRPPYTDIQKMVVCIHKSLQSLNATLSCYNSQYAVYLEHQIGIWHPSTKSKHCGTTDLVLNSLITSSISSPDGNLMYCFMKTFTIALHVSRTISETVDCPMPNKWATVLYSIGVAKHHKQTATLLCTDNDLCMTVLFLSNSGIKQLQM